uniref:Uncharacterized protein n=1 Tax=Rhizophora mucronata TaxID=61149 RepID=A0A2P2NRD2_RHIMU
MKIEKNSLQNIFLILCNFPFN